MAEKMTALIFGACPEPEWDFLRQSCPSPHLVLAADGGIRWAVAAGYRSDVIIGDWDSGGGPLEGAEVISLQPEKDLTDLQAAAEVALERGCTRIILTACLGGRLDQTLGNLGLLEWLASRGIEAFLLGSGNEARFWDGSVLEIERDDRYRFLSLIPLDERIIGVTLRGVKYPLEGAALTRGDTLSISNEVLAPRAVLSAEKGRMLVIRSQKFNFS